MLRFQATAFGLTKQLLLTTVLSWFRDAEHRSGQRAAHAGALAAHLSGSAARDAALRATWGAWRAAAWGRVERRRAQGVRTRACDDAVRGVPGLLRAARVESAARAGFAAWVRHTRVCGVAWAAGLRMVVCAKTRNGRRLLLGWRQVAASLRARRERLVAVRGVAQAVWARAGCAGRSFAAWCGFAAGRLRTAAGGSGRIATALSVALMSSANRSGEAAAARVSSAWLRGMLRRRVVTRIAQAATTGREAYLLALVVSAWRQLAIGRGKEQITEFVSGRASVFSFSLWRGAARLDRLRRRCLKAFVPCVLPVVVRAWRVGAAARQLGRCVPLATLTAWRAGAVRRVNRRRLEAVLAPRSVCLKVAMVAWRAFAARRGVVVAAVEFGERVRRVDFVRVACGSGPPQGARRRDRTVCGRRRGAPGVAGGVCVRHAEDLTRYLASSGTCFD